MGGSQCVRNSQMESEEDFSLVTPEYQWVRGGGAQIIFKCLL